MLFFMKMLLQTRLFHLINEGLQAQPGDSYSYSVLNKNKIDGCILFLTEQA